MKNNVYLIAILLVVFTGMCIGYGAKTAPTTATEKLEGREIVVQGSEYSFSPSEIKASPGEKIRLTFKNIGKLPHTYTVSELNLNTGTVSPGQSKSVDFTAPSSSATFQSFCAVPGHKESGMVGKLVVG